MYKLTYPAFDWRPVELVLFRLCDENNLLNRAIFKFVRFLINNLLLIVTAQHWYDINTIHKINPPFTTHHVLLRGFYHLYIIYLQMFFNKNTNCFILFHICNKKKLDFSSVLKLLICWLNLQIFCCFYYLYRGSIRNK